MYWTRLGEYLPTSSGQQREARLKTALRGQIPDGGLFRMSSLGDPDRAFARLNRFAADAVMAVAPQARAALIGTALAQRLA